MASLPWSTIPELNAVLEIAAREKRFDEAMRVCERYCAEHPQDGEGFVARARLHLMMKRFDLQLMDVEAWIRLTPAPHAGQFAIRAGALMKLGRWHEALADWDRVEAGDVDAWFGPYVDLRRAECHLGLGDLDAVERACAAVPDDYTLPGFMGQLQGSKFDMLDEVARRRDGVGR